MSKGQSRFNIVIFEPEIPGNTGTIGRTCLALDATLHLIHPLGFDLREKAVRRAGLDYWKHVKLSEYDSWEHFLTISQAPLEQLILFSKNGKQYHYQANYTTDCYLIFGPETRGLPDSLLKDYEKQTFKLPMFSDKVRSINLSNAVTAVAYEALRQIGFK
ncbi:MAG: tRNA (cytidine(34)-2'-O)-methyltransferase [Bdellovibrionales bacterium]|jgi:tRNA (cytidine/uridine-2'-O-)-methyltransferase|nr:tRNA (cytidine(34)-2'-O)-methyltransferase [Bdellovibrionales bacterium]MBT3525000.1 tRNA (cytidine(34)-2'-O)-methyltransferase [Bdellovibrionales bacterium]MBT7669167.1 tRNA (cytidine(34)-2'-O)-methyltransferase [Bdellovibrionales bacterium]